MQRPAAVLFSGLMVGCVAQPAPSVTHAPASVEPELAISHEELGVDYVLPGPVIEHDGALHAWPVVFPTADDPPRVVHLTSDDGRTWDGDAGTRAVEGSGLGLGTVGPIPSTVLVEDDGTWLMYGGGRQIGDHPVVWRATAPGPDGPWHMHPEPVLEPSAQRWDSAITDHPSVVATDAGYLMAYGGASGSDPNRNRIGLATSTDGLTWTPVASTLEGADDDEALGPSACGIEARTMFEPELAVTEVGLRLYWGAMVGGDEMVIGVAESSDGVAWTCAVEGPLLTAEDIDGGGAWHSYAVVRADGPDRILVEVLGDGSSDVWEVSGLSRGAAPPGSGDGTGPADAIGAYARTTAGRTLPQP